MPLTVLSVAYPLATVGPDAVGGAEQILRLIDRHLIRAGHHSIVIAAEGSSVAGRLVSTPLPHGTLDSDARAAAIEHHRRALQNALSRWQVDIVHMHGHEFDRYLPPGGIPTLATVHLPPELLLADLTAIDRPRTWVHGVSTSQNARLPQVPWLLPPIENGVDVDDVPRQVRRRGFALALGRICPEKGFHIALDAARRARIPLLLGGRVFPYAEHQRYFHTEIAPRINDDRRFIGPVTLARKLRLFTAARCLLVPSQIAETSSLVAMEALACGTPVIAFPAGALPEIIDHGLTGFVVRDLSEMADAIRDVDSIDPEVCRATARARFSADRMFRQYLERYQQLASCASLSVLHARSGSSV